MHYSFVEYGGSCITHWSFLDEQEGINVDRLCGRLFLIADGDTTTKWKQERHTQLEQKLKNRYCRLSCKEVENLLAPPVLKQVLVGYGEANVSDFPQKDYYKKPLGAFLDGILDGNRKRKGSYADNGSISDKIGFCAKALCAMTTFEDLSSEAQQIAEKIYKFIADNNTSRTA